MAFDFAELLAAQNAAAAAEQIRANEAKRVAEDARRVAEEARREAEEAALIAEKAANVAHYLQGMQSERAAIDRDRVSYKDSQKSIEDRERQLKEAKIECDKKAAELKEREAEFDRKMLATIRLSKESRIQPELRRTTTPALDLGLTFGPECSAGAVSQVASTPEESQLEDSALDIGFTDESVKTEAKIALKTGSSTLTVYERTGAAIGLENVDFTTSQPIINADGAVASNFQVSHGRAENYQALRDDCTHIIDKNGYLYALSCAVDGCGANARSGKSEKVFFDGLNGILAHCRAAHKNEWLPTLDGCASATNAAVEADKSSSQLTPVTPMDLASMIAGKMPSRFAWNTGKNREESKARYARKPGADRRSLSGARPVKRARMSKDREDDDEDYVPSFSGFQEDTFDFSSYHRKPHKTAGNSLFSKSDCDVALKQQSIVVKLRLPKAVLASFPRTSATLSSDFASPDEVEHLLR
ncbi:hypothetical protein LTR08_007252 [Meristemomyces frigidus]|nr:hypothetical protein LTR08_007252 [Meristemomyces frigidus]